MNIETFSQDSLRIEKSKAQTLNLVFRGKSMSREPGKFLLPIISQALLEADAAGLRLVLDFRKLEYFNSSTLTPIVRVLDRAVSSKTQLTIRYDQNLSWQRLSFSALAVFATEDGRLALSGVQDD